MAKDICVEFYELNLTTKNKRSSKNIDAPPIENVEIFKAFELLNQYKNNIIGHLFKYQNNQHATALEHLDISHIDGKYRVDLVISYYDATAPHRTLEDITSRSINVQKRKDDEAVKHLVHCVIKENTPLIAEVGIEKLTGCPASRVEKTLGFIFKLLQELAPNSERVFQITNPDGARNSDGSDDIRSFILQPCIYPMIGDDLRNAIDKGLLKFIKIQGKRTTKLDDPNNRLAESKAALFFKPVVKREGESIVEYFKSTVDAALRNKQGINTPKTFAIIQNEDTGSEQSIEISTGNELNSAFVLRRRFDAMEGRKAQPDNTTVNSIYLNEIWRKFP